MCLSSPTLYLPSATGVTALEKGCFFPYLFPIVLIIVHALDEWMLQGLLRKVKSSLEALTICCTTHTMYAMSAELKLSCFKVDKPHFVFYCFAGEKVFVHDFILTHPDST